MTIVENFRLPLILLATVGSAVTVPHEPANRCI